MTWSGCLCGVHMSRNWQLACDRSSWSPGWCCLSICTLFACIWRLPSLVEHHVPKFVFASYDVVVDHQMTSGTVDHWGIPVMLVVWWVLLELSGKSVSLVIGSCTWRELLYGSFVVLVAWDPPKAGCFWEHSKIFSDLVKDIPAGRQGIIREFRPFWFSQFLHFLH
jgi:hypothetical protein